MLEYKRTDPRRWAFEDLMRPSTKWADSAISAVSESAVLETALEEQQNVVQRGGSPPRKLRILHVLFSSQIAGSERYCIDLANRQSELGHAVHVAGTNGSPIRALLSPSVTYHSFSYPFLRGRRLHRLITRASIDICHGHLGRACKTLARMPRAVTKVATLHVGYKAKQHDKFDGLICVNNAQLTRLGAYPGKVGLVPNWLPDWHSSEPVDLRAKLNVGPDALLIGGVGRLHKSKGFDVLISAFRQAAPADAVLAIIGEGKEMRSLARLAANDRRIHLLGHCRNVPAFLRNLDLFVSPSREESFGLAILEAMQEGLPLISTATDGPSEYLQSFPVSLVEPGSTNSLAEALAKAIQGTRQSHSTRIDYDMRQFSRSTGVNRVLEFYAVVSDLWAEVANNPVSHV